MRLQERLVRQIEQGIFCDVDPLGELVIYAREVRQTAPLPEHRVLAFMLECVLGRLRYDQEDRSVSLSESRAFRRQFRDPVTTAANCLTGKGGDVLAIAEALVRAASEALPT